MYPEDIARHLLSNQKAALTLLHMAGEADSVANLLPNEKRMRSYIQSFDHMGLLAKEGPLSGERYLSETGEGVVACLKESLSDGDWRFDLVVRAMLNAIQRGAPLDEITDVCGTRISDTERQDSFNFIVDNELAETISALGCVIGRANPTWKTREALRVPGLLSSWCNPKQKEGHLVANTTNISGGNIASVITGGQEHFAEIQQNINEFDAKGFVAEIDSILQKLSEWDNIGEFKAELREIRDHAESADTNKSSIRERLSSALKTAAEIATVVPAISWVVRKLVELLDYVQD